PISYCLLAAICNHSYVPVCAMDMKLSDYKRFTDECDVYEYNCDKSMNYQLVEYQDCTTFSTTTGCPSLDKLMTKILGYYIFEPNGIKKRYSPELTIPTFTFPRARRENGGYTTEMTREVEETTPCSPCERNKMLLAALEAKERTMEQVFMSTSTKKKPSSRQVKRASTEATIVLKKETVWKNGKIMHKIIKGPKPKPKVAKKKNVKPKSKPPRDSSDFLEN
ncbi:hypothetical protein SFRURICE_007993, partial [Spodoptera frugiperda]